MTKTITRHAAHVEEIRPGVAGLYLGEADPDGMGDDGYALIDADGRIQWTAEDCENRTFSEFEMDRTTGAYILPETAYYVIREEMTIERDAPTIVEIRTQPGTTNMSHEPRTDGWLGTTNNRAKYAHGQYDSESEARTFVGSKWTDAYGIDVDKYEAEELGIIARFRGPARRDGDIFSYTVPGESPIWEQMDRADLSCEWLVTIDVSNSEVSDEMKAILIAEGFEEDADPTEIDDDDLKMMILRHGYSKVQIIKEETEGGIFYVLAQK